MVGGLKSRYIGTSISRQSVGTKFNARRRGSDLSKRNFSAEVIFLDLHRFTIALLLRERAQMKVSIGSYGEPDTLTSSSPPKLSCAFGFWRAFCCFLNLAATTAGESPLS